MGNKTLGNKKRLKEVEDFLRQNEFVFVEQTFHDGCFNSTKGVNITTTTKEISIILHNLFKDNSFLEL